MSRMRKKNYLVKETVVLREKLETTICKIHEENSNRGKSG